MRPQFFSPVKSIPQDTRCFDFRFPRQDMRLRVELSGDDVTVRASRNGFSEQRKSAFIRELAAEGFIPDMHRWYFAHDGHNFGRGVKWVIDRSWTEVEEAREAQAWGHRLFVGSFSTTLVATALLMGLLFSGNLGSFRVQASPAAHVAASLPASASLG